MKKDDFPKMNLKPKAVKPILGQDLLGVILHNPLDLNQVFEILPDPEIDRGICVTGLHPLTPAACPKDFQFSLGLGLDRRPVISEKGKIIHSNPEIDNMSIYEGMANEAVLLSLSKRRCILDIKEITEVPIPKDISSKEKVYLM